MINNSKKVEKEKSLALNEEKNNFLNKENLNNIDKEKTNELQQNTRNLNEKIKTEEISKKNTKEINSESNEKKWIQECKIIKNSLKKTFFQNYFVYEISYKIGSTNYIILRKFTDFVAFREILRKMFPCVFLLPLNVKGLFVKKDNNFIKERIAILQNFLNYLITNKNIFDCEPIWIFFDSIKEDSNVGDQLGILLEPDNKEILNYYENIFPDYFQNSNNISSYYEINQFVIKIKTNEEFYRRLNDLSKNMINQKQIKHSKILENFFNNIVIPLSDEKKIYSEFSKNVESVGEFNLKEYFSSFKNKLEDILYEIEAYKEIFKDFDKFNNLFLEKNTKKISLEKNLNILNNQEILKLEKISNVKNDLKNLEDDLNVLEHLIEIFYQILKFREINLILKRKKLLVYKSINILAKQISNLMREKLAFWSKIKDLSQEIVKREDKS